MARIFLLLLVIFVLLLPHVSQAATPTLTLTWEDNSNNEDGFIITRRVGTVGAYIEIARVLANVLTYVDNSPLLYSTLYCYQLSSFNVVGASVGSADGCGRTSAPPQLLRPAVPSNLRITPTAVGPQA